MTLPSWIEPAWRVLADALAQERLHHALLLGGPRGYGKRALADAFAAAALCTDRSAEGRACARCRACLLVAAGTHPDLARVTFALRDDGRARSEITVDQLRALGERLALASQFGGLKIAIVDPADAMNPSAANALLKTLEEPAPGTVIVLVADDPSRLPPTIRSRCQRIVIPRATRAEAREWLRAQGIGDDVAEQALDASLDNPGQAAEWATDGGLGVRAECMADLAALSASRTRAAAVAERWAADRPEVRLWLAAALARDEARLIAAGRSGPLGLTAREEIPKLTRWFGRANQARGLLATPVRAELVLIDLLRDWPARPTGRA
jgi:DNA polymerase III subunit delta'